MKSLKHKESLFDVKCCGLGKKKDPSGMHSTAPCATCCHVAPHPV